MAMTGIPLPAEDRCRIASTRELISDSALFASKFSFSRAVMVETLWLLCDWM